LTLRLPNGNTSVIRLAPVNSIQRRSTPQPHPPVEGTYEEENSPFEQRRKFEDQLRYGKATGEAGEIDESYLALPYLS
jgi:hypothetical protein